MSWTTAFVATALLGFVTAAMSGPAAGQSLGTQESVADTAIGRMLEAPVNTRPVAQKWWWDDAWFEDGQLGPPENHAVEERDGSYINPIDDTEVPGVIFRPKTPGKFPGMLFQHGRRGLDELVKRLARRMAARGFVVLAPDVFAARFIDAFPVTHLRIFASISSSEPASPLLPFRAAM